MILYKYKKESSGRHGEFILRPVADVYIRSSSGVWIEFHPYIDSGADVTLIPLSLGKLIGLSLETQKIEQIGGIRGSVPVIYQQSLLRIGNVEIVTRVAWALTEEVPPLLGRADVFDRFDVTFRQHEGIIIFEKLTTWV